MWKGHKKVGQLRSRLTCQLPSKWLFWSPPNRGRVFTPGNCHFKTTQQRSLGRTHVLRFFWIEIEMDILSLCSSGKNSCQSEHFRIFVPGPKTYTAGYFAGSFRRQHSLHDWTIQFATQLLNGRKAERETDPRRKHLSCCLSCKPKNLNLNVTKLRTETKLPGEKTMLRHSKLEIKDALTNAPCTDRRESGSKTSTLMKALNGWAVSSSHWWFSFMYGIMIPSSGNY